jgi:mycofactocin biosynthetic radical S-adenosylmethionine protein MftC
VKFSTNGAFIDARTKAARLASMDYLDIQISLDGIDEATNDAVRGPGSYAMARRAMDILKRPGSGRSRSAIVVTRHNVDQLDGFKALADSYGAQLRVTRLRPSRPWRRHLGRPAPHQRQQRQIYHWLLAHGENVLTGDSFFHLNALGESLPGLNMCGAGRVVCLIDPIGDVYACPFVIHDEFKAGNVRDDGGFTSVWRESELFTSCASRSRRGLRQLRQLRRLPGRLHGRQVLHRPAARRTRPRVRRAARVTPAAHVDPRHAPKPSMDHSKPARVTLTRKPLPVAGA